jgi:hypothetical protein
VVVLGEVGLWCSVVGEVIHSFTLKKENLIFADEMNDFAFFSYRTNVR